ncbi:MAG TPA: gamma carbonic anhydrase family protein [Ignavibacteria bacterium]|mgnify:CR=1 FL=1|nr:gamma carbonic anhydrase family protein [Ignavibacteria bacterium]
MIIPFKDKFPVYDESVFIAANASVIGDVILGRETSVWFNAVIRGDVNFIRIGERTNIQDGSVLHVTHDKYSLHIGNDVTIGHNAVVHGCTIKDRVLIGMGSVLLDDSTVNSDCLIAAGSLIKENFIVPEGVLAAGVPAKIIRDLNVEEIAKIRQSAQNYIAYAQDYILSDTFSR